MPGKAAFLGKPKRCQVVKQGAEGFDQGAHFHDIKWVGRLKLK
jgi:hypothetical protein